ncbi:serine protease FAM111A-like [Triplophysa dalaica]|uniref:serine protease FAM111A-like n=1 Tax=Triplophysa dalaica TaxID=1582913 RepID=UPI0024DF77EC|nr:serine protease FAM111A-like [Triplophysa dalaica]
MDKVPMKKDADEFSKDQQQDKKGKDLHFQLNSETYLVHCNPSMTVLDALNKSPSFREENKKQVLILRSANQMPKAAVKTDFPCCLIDHDEIIDVSFIKNDGSMTEKKQHKSLPSNPDQFVTFFIKKRGGHNLVLLLKSKVLRSRVEYVCVYAHKEETLKIALKRDGRFNNNLFLKRCALYEFGTEIIHEMTQPVEALDQKIFKVIVLRNTKQPDSQEDLTLPVQTEPDVASDVDVTDDADTRQTPVNTEHETKHKKNPNNSTRPSARRSAPKEIPDSEEILELLREQFAGLLQQVKRRENLLNNSQQQKFFRGEFAKSVESFLEVKKIKKLAELSDAVCQIRVEGKPEGTGFLLFDRYVLTNAHVIGPFVIHIQDPHPWRLQKTVTTAFIFEDYQSAVTELPVKGEVFAFAYGEDSQGRHLDYALLELAADPHDDIPQLYSHHSYSPPHPGSQICIVGHPGKGVKKVDPCFIIDLVNAQRPMDNPIHVITPQYFENNKITYDSCFTYGSSGSPVFDEHCFLIGIHTGFFTHKDESTSKGKIIEYAYSLEPIIEDIRKVWNNRGMT